jgi:hypothetical protein
VTNNSVSGEAVARRESDWEKNRKKTSTVGSLKPNENHSRAEQASSVKGPNRGRFDVPVTEGNSQDALGGKEIIKVREQINRNRKSSGGGVTGAHVNAESCVYFADVYQADQNYLGDQTRGDGSSAPIESYGPYATAAEAIAAAKSNNHRRFVAEENPVKARINAGPGADKVHESRGQHELETEVGGAHRVRSRVDGKGKTEGSLTTSSDGIGSGSDGADRSGYVKQTRADREKEWETHRKASSSV